MKRDTLRRGMRLLLLSVLLIFACEGKAQDEFNLIIHSPSVDTITRSLADRFEVLKEHFATGAIGLTSDGMIAMRDNAALSVEVRSSVEGLISEDNKDRITLYREIARVNGRPDWEASLRSTFAERWIGRAPSGWFYRESGGTWIRKK